MSDIGLLERTIERLGESLPELHRKLRLAAVTAVARAVINLNDGEIDDQAALIVALVRAAAASGKSWLRKADLKRALTSAIVQADSSRQAALRMELGLTGGGFRERHPDSAVWLEAASRQQADIVDQCSTALKVAAELLPNVLTPQPRARRLDTSRLLSLSMDLVDASLPDLVREEALAVIAALLKRLPVEERLMTLGVERIRFLRHLALDATAGPFLPIAALSAYLATEDVEGIELVTRMLVPSERPDAFLVRAAVVRELGHSHTASHQEVISLLETCLKDPSEHVRQRCCEALKAVGSDDSSELLRRAATSDISPRVRAYAILRLGELVQFKPSAYAAYLLALGSTVRDSEVLVQKASLESVYVDCRSLNVSIGGDELASVLAKSIESASPTVAELLALKIRQLEIRAHPDVDKLLGKFVQLRRTLRIGQSVTLAAPHDLAPAWLERIALCVAAFDVPWGLTLSKDGLCIQRGEVARFGAWRFFYELTHPAPDKRQAHLHAHVRSIRAGLVTVPLRMAEVTKTRVPGERVVVSGHSWGGFLPRPADLVLAARRRKGLRLSTVHGELTIHVPRGVLSRLWLSFLLVLTYRRLSELRLRALGATRPEQQIAYIQSLMRRGFTFSWERHSARFGSHEYSLLPKRIINYFEPNKTPEQHADSGPTGSTLQMAVMPLPSLLAEDALRYLLAPSGNTAWHLAIVIWVILTIMVLRAAMVQTRFERAKRQIPLSIGGWGSRGKSGTERLKAALFHAQHFDVVSKTTGCEAMMIVARRGQPADELFLYRPYDKATIWEQEAVVEYAQHLEAQVFLWECMALQPEFVDILNREWMQDRITTITNTYPDHEDIMGPTGQDVAEAIARFVPRAGVVLSSEEQMLPMLQEVAQVNESRLLRVSELDGALIPADLLARFPYDEHPNNIALVARLAEHLGINAERAIIEMADNVVPDLGVLKTYPEIEYAGRRISFVNGMSANERAGFLSNWQRLGFDQHDADAEPRRMVIAVVNNRADRIPRSKTFAELLIRDARFDRIVVIGTGAQAMKRLLQEAARAFSADLSLPSDPAAAVATASAVFAQHLGTLTTLDALRVRLSCVFGVDTLPEALSQALEATDAAAESTELARLEHALTELSLHLRAAAETPVVAEYLESIVFEWGCCRGVLQKVRVLSQSGHTRKAVGALAQGYLECLKRRISVLDDSGASGDQVLDFAARSFPPGLSGRLLGCQNIKGTGLDFVYRWLSIERVSKCMLGLNEVSARGGALRFLSGYAGYGIADCLMVREYLESLDIDESDWAAFRTEVASLKHILEQRSQELNARLKGGSQPGLMSRVLGHIEPLVDHLDSVRRSRAAERVMRAVIEGRLSQPRAAERLRAVVARQKGGWLAKDTHAFLSKLDSLKPWAKKNGS